MSNNNPGVDGSRAGRCPSMPFVPAPPRRPERRAGMEWALSDNAPVASIPDRSSLTEHLTGRRSLFFAPLLILLANSRRRSISRHLAKMGTMENRNPTPQAARTNSPTVSAAIGTPILRQLCRARRGVQREPAHGRPGPYGRVSGLDHARERRGVRIDIRVGMQDEWQSEKRRLRPGMSRLTPSR
jgi:hypothetical protein